MGVDILGRTAENPIGIQDRKGELGSYPALRDQSTVNPEFGTLDGLKGLVAHALAMGTKLILDWVANPRRRTILGR